MYPVKWAKRLAAAALAGALTLCMAPAALAQESELTQRELGSNRYTQPAQAADEPAGYGLDGFAPLMENDTLAVYYRAQTGALRIQDKRSGYVWGMVAEDKPENLNDRWAGIANSLVQVGAFDAEGSEERVGASGGALTCVAQGESAAVDVWLEDWQIGFSFEMSLEGNSLCFTMQDASIREEGDWQLADVTFVPFLGAVEGDSVPGYIFVPDGSGALMRFLSPRNYLQGYEKRIYGADFAIDSINSSYSGTQGEDTATEEATASLPLFGITHGEGCNAFLAVASHGEEYGTIMAEPAGLVCDYSRAGVRFAYRQLYEQPISRVGLGVQTVQPQRNAVDPQICYYFLTGEDADYVGMAGQYRELLVEAGALTRTQPQGATPLRVDFLAADLEKEFIGSSVRTATDMDTVRRAYDELTQDGVINLQIGLRGWQEKGLSGYKKTDDSTASVYGGASALAGLAGEMPLWLALDTFTAKEGQFDERSEGGISLSQSLVVKNGGEDDWLGDTYYLKPEKALAALCRQMEALSGEGLANFLVDGMGEALYGEYLDDAQQSRADVRSAVQQTARALAGQYGRLTFTRPNAYLFEAAGTYDQIPMAGSQFLYETDSVPFLQIVLSGYMELYAPYANLSFFSDMDRLKMIDYNTCPTYLLTQLDNYELRNTASAGLASTRYEDWRAHIAETYRQVSAVLDHTRGQVWLDREVLEQGFVCNTYEEGAVYVNYNASARTAPDGTSVPAGTAVYVERG